MPNEIKQKFVASGNLTISLASLPSSISGVGRQSTIVDNMTNKYQDVAIYSQVTVGTSPTSGTSVYLYLIRDDNQGYRTDGARSTDNPWTGINSQVIGVLQNRTPQSNTSLYGDFTVNQPGPLWGIGVSHDTAVNLNSTAGNHFIRWVGINPDIQ